MARSIKKGPFVDKSLMNKIKKLNENNKKEYGKYYIPLYINVYDEQNIEQLTYERNKFEAVVMSIVNGVVVCDNYDKVILVNPAAQSMLEI